MKRRYYILIIFGILLLIWGIFSILGIGVRCYDGNSYTFYISKSEFTNSIEEKLDITDGKFYYIKDLSVIDNLDKIAHVSYVCDRVTYSIKVGDRLKWVGKKRYNKFLESKLTELVKFSSKGWAGPAYFIHDYTNNKDYVIDFEKKNIQIDPTEG